MTADGRALGKENQLRKAVSRQTKSSESLNNYNLLGTILVPLNLKLLLEFH